MLCRQTVIAPTAKISPNPYELLRRRWVYKDKVDDEQNR